MATVQYSYDNVAFYQRSFKEAGVEPGDLKTLDWLPKFPFVVKQDMRDAYRLGCSPCRGRLCVNCHADLRVLPGEATVVGCTANDLKYWASALRAALPSAIAMRTPPRQDRLRLRFVHRRPGRP